MTTRSRTRKVAVWLLVSTEDQKVDAQHGVVERYAKARGWTVVARFGVPDSNGQDPTIASSSTASCRKGDQGRSARGRGRLSGVRAQLRTRRMPVNSTKTLRRDSVSRMVNGSLNLRRTTCTATVTRLATTPCSSASTTVMPSGSAPRPSSCTRTPAVERPSRYRQWSARSRRRGANWRPRRSCSLVVGHRVPLLTEPRHGPQPSRARQRRARDPRPAGRYDRSAATAMRLCAISTRSASATQFAAARPGCRCDHPPRARGRPRPTCPTAAVRLPPGRAYAAWARSAMYPPA